MQKVFNSLMCLGVFFSWIFREVGLYSKSFLSVTGADLRERFLQLLGKALSLLGLQRSCLPGRAFCFQRHPGEEGLSWKEFRQELRGCSDLLCRTPRQDLPAPPSAGWLCLFQSQSLPSPGLHIQPGECGNSGHMTWELWL